MKKSEMNIIAALIDKTLAAPDNVDNLNAVRTAVKELVDRFPLYTELRKSTE